MPESIIKLPEVELVLGSITAEFHQAAQPTIASSDGSEDWSSLVDELLSIRLLKEDWDGQDAVAPSAAIVDTAIRLAMRFQRDGLPSADRVAAGPSGTVFFEWHSPRNYIEVEVASPGVAEVREVLDGITTEYSIQ